MKKTDFKSEYMLLDRLRIDCEYYIKNKNMGANAKCLWALDEKKQIEKMRELYDLLPIKPEWLTKEKIDEYEKKMIKL